jgi:hypothetical protein
MRNTFAPAWRPFHLADVAPTIRMLAGLPVSDRAGGSPILPLVAATAAPAARGF